MTKLSQRLSRDVAGAYAECYGLRPRRLLHTGELLVDRSAHPVDSLKPVIQARSHALAESLRWGEPYTFFLAPGIISWMIPLVNEYEIAGGLIGGEVVAEDDAQDRLEAVNHFSAAGCSRADAEDYVRRLPAWPQSRTQEAADHLYVLFYQMSGWTPMLLRDRREQTAQQQQIAEEVHRRKTRKDGSYPLNDERMLISLIRAGDKNGARGLLNRMLGAVFLKSANLTVVRALMIEMMGYLVRTAVEDSPYLEPLLEKNHEWMARIIEASDFEDLSNVLRDALDDFMNNIYLRGYKPTNASVEAALDYMATHFRKSVSLDDVAYAVGLSSFRIAHLMKEHTGKTIIQHIHRLRIQEAQRLLEQTAQPCAEIAYEVGFGDQSYFTKQFRLLTGITPAKHRKSYRIRP